MQRKIIDIVPSTFDLVFPPYNQLSSFFVPSSLFNNSGILLESPFHSVTLRGRPWGAPEGRPFYVTPKGRPCFSSIHPIVVIFGSSPPLRMYFCESPFHSVALEEHPSDAPKGRHYF